VNLGIITVCIMIAGLFLTVYCLVRLGVSYRVVKRDLERRITPRQCRRERQWAQAQEVD
jgi:ABC-type nickel/cobalt efflux system permease component RcnA